MEVSRHGVGRCSQGPNRSVQRAFRVFLAAFTSLWAVAFCILIVRSFVFHRPHPYNSFLLNPAGRFWDFTVFAPRYALWGQGDQFFGLAGFPFTYPAPTMIAGLFYYRFFLNPLHAYLLSLLLFAAGLGCCAAWALPNESPARKLGAVIVLVGAIFSFPLLFLLDRGNLEGLVWFASAIGLAFFLRRWFTAAAIFLALAASMKIFPGILLLLFLGKRRYVEFGLAIAACGVFTAVSLWFAGPSIPLAASHVIFGMDNFRHVEIFEYHPSAIGFDHSLFSLVKQGTHFFIHDVARLDSLLPSLYLVYFGFCAVFFMFLYGKFVRKLPVLNQLLILSTLSVTLPFVSYDYTLVHMFVPFAALIFFLVGDVALGRVALTYPQMLVLLLPFAVLLTPQSYLLYGIVGFGGQVKAAALAGIVAAALNIKLPSTLLDEEGPGPSVTVAALQETDGALR